MEITAAMVSELRVMTNAGIVDCKNALTEAQGDLAKAVEILRKKGIAKAGSKTERAVKEGLVYSYIHGGGKVGVLVEVLCETDFVARTEQFKELVHDVAMHIAAANPLFVSREQVSPEMVAKEREIALEGFAGSGKPQEMLDKIAEGKLLKFYSEVCLLDQPFIKDEDKTVGELLKEKIGTIGENIQVRRFSRYALGA